MIFFLYKSTQTHAPEHFFFTFHQQCYYFPYQIREGLSSSIHFHISAAQNVQLHSFSYILSGFIHFSMEPTIDSIVPDTCLYDVILYECLISALDLKIMTIPLSLGVEGSQSTRPRDQINQKSMYTTKFRDGLQTLLVQAHHTALLSLSSIDRGFRVIVPSELEYASYKIHVSCRLLRHQSCILVMCRAINLRGLECKN